MSFLFPLYLLGAAAIAIPILLHLRRRPPKDHQTFSSLMFLEKSPERLTRRTRVERWLLLALRCLALILLAIMFGRPFLRSAQMPGEDQEGRRLVVMIDGSASMRRSDLWERAMGEAEEVLADTGVNDEVALVWFDDRFEVVRSFEGFENVTGSARVVALNDWAKEGEETLPGWRSTHLGAALTGAADLMADANTQHEMEEQEIVVISDFQEGAERDSLNRFAWPEVVKVRPIVITPKTDAGNLALHLVAASEDEQEMEREENRTGLRPPRRRVRITNGRESETEQFSLTWLGEEKNRIEGFLPAGASRVMAVPPRAEETRDGILEIQGDGQDFDNRVYVARAQPRPVRLLYVGAEASAEDVGSPLFYLSRAMHRTPAIDPSVTGITFEEIAVHPEVLSEIEVAVVRLNDQTPEVLPEALKKFAASGKLVLAIITEGTEAKTLKKLTGIESLELGEAKVDDYAMLAEIDFDHPVLAPFAQAQIRDFTKIHTWRHRSLSFPESEENGARVLARFDDGSPAWMEWPEGDRGGKLFLFLSGWEPRESQLALSSKFVPLVYGLLGQAGFSAVAEPTRYVGDGIPLPGNETEIRVVPPEPGEAVSAGKGETEFVATERPGFYRVESVDALGRSQSRVYAINLPPDESRLEPVDPVVALGEFGVPVVTASRNTSADAGEALLTESQRRRVEAEEKERNQKLWKWLLVAVLAILVVETWLAGRRRISSSAPASAEAA
ncbi:MAG: BatA domain-containing protein [Verrucomicrobiae bacterium]|nr:BatA domain-containing protein [Verrucomicrobiae bacterium]